MSDTGYYPPEYGIEVGEKCGRDRCTGRIIFEPDYCDLDPEDPDARDDAIDDGNVCNQCGWRRSWEDY